LPSIVISIAIASAFNCKIVNRGDCVSFCPIPDATSLRKRVVRYCQQLLTVKGALDLLAFVLDRDRVPNAAGNFTLALAICFLWSSLT